MLSSATNSNSHIPTGELDGLQNLGSTSIRWRLKKPETEGITYVLQAAEVTWVTWRSWAPVPRDTTHYDSDDDTVYMYYLLTTSPGTPYTFRVQEVKRERGSLNGPESAKIVTLEASRDDEIRWLRQAQQKLLDLRARGGGAAPSPPSEDAQLLAEVKALVAEHGALKDKLTKARVARTAAQAAIEAKAQEIGNMEADIITLQAKCAALAPRA